MPVILCIVYADVTLTRSKVRPRGDDRQPPSGAIFTGSIARSATRRYLIYSEAAFEVFRAQERHFAPIGVKFDMVESVHSSLPNFTPIGATVRVQEPKN